MGRHQKRSWISKTLMAMSWFLFLLASILVGNSVGGTMKSLVMFFSDTFALIRFGSTERWGGSDLSCLPTAETNIVDKFLDTGVVDKSGVVANLAPVISFAEVLELLSVLSACEIVRGCAIDARVVPTGKHEQLSILPVADWAWVIHLWLSGSEFLFSRWFLIIIKGEKWK